MPRIIGIINTKFKTKDTGTTIEGKTIHTTEPISPERGKGEETDHFFLSAAKLAALDFDPAPGQTVDVLYNRYGKVATMKLVDDDIVIDVG